MIRVVSDTISSIPISNAVVMQIDYLPQIIIFGNESYRDDSEITPSIFLKKLRASSSLPKTAAPPPELYHPIYESISKAGDTAIVLCPSSDLSGTFRNASVASSDFPNADIRIIDTRTVGYGLGSIVIQVLIWINQGMSAEEIVHQVQEMASRNRTYFIVDTMEYLYKGGRIGGAKALVGSILQIKPILQIKNGTVQAADTQRTKSKAIARIKHMVETECPRDGKSYLAVMHGDAEDEAKELAEYFSITLGIDDIPICEMPPAILVHSGPGVLGVSFFI